MQEFKVQTNSLGPEYGRFAGGVINLTSKLEPTSSMARLTSSCAIKY